MAIYVAKCGKCHFEFLTPANVIHQVCPNCEETNACSIKEKR